MSRYWLVLYQAEPDTNTRWRKIVDEKFVSSKPVTDLELAAIDLLDAVVDEPEASPNPQSPAASPDLSDEPVQH